MTTFTYTKPTVGGSEDTWGDTLNANWDAVAAFVGPLDSTELAVLDGITASTAELNLLDGVTSSTAELNLLDGVTATTAEINYLDGVTSAIQDQIDNIPTPPELTQVEAEDDTSTVFGQVSGQRLAQAVAANTPTTVGAVGTYAFLREVDLNASSRSPGDSVSGSSLQYLSIAAPNDTGLALQKNIRPSGTWMLMGSYSDDLSTNDYPASVWLRIS